MKAPDDPSRPGARSPGPAGGSGRPRPGTRQLPAAHGECVALGPVPGLVELDRARHEVEQLRSALQSNRTIGVAIGVLMATRHVDRDTAFAMLRTASQRRNRKLRDVAADVEFAGRIPDHDDAA